MENIKVCILDYGSGNVKSVRNIFSSMTEDVVVSNESSVIEEATHIVLPGVGAFGASMEKIRTRIPVDTLEREVLVKKKPFLGICVGMQVLADKGYEFGEHDGLGWISGEVTKLETKGMPLPHIGWNAIQILRECAILRQFADNQDFYFVHSYAFRERVAAAAAARTSYGEEFTSAINMENIFGVQFHPEKSQKAGALLVRNFLGFK